MKSRNFPPIFYLLSVLALITASCSEGMFNFSEETGNVSFRFGVASTAGEDLSKLVFNLENQDSGDSVKRELSISSDSSDVGCFIYRIDTGSWELNTTVYLSDGTVAAERTDSFQLEFSETLIADFSFWSDGTNSGIDVSWESSGEEAQVALISVTGSDVLLSAYHPAASAADDISFVTSIICQGSGFSTGLGGIELTFPDQSVFSYNSGSRLVSNLEITATASLLTINRGEILPFGDYGLTLTDLNDVEVSANMNFSLAFDPSGSTAIITTSAYAGSNTLSSSDYDKQDYSSVGTYIIYNVVAGDGTMINYSAGAQPPDVFDDPSSATNLTMSGIYINTGTTIYIVLATVDADLSQTDIDNVFVSGTTNLLPEKFAGWLYSQFPDQINYVGLSVAEYTP